MSDLIFEVEDHLAKIILNRPESANSFSEEMLLKWIDALCEVRDNDDIYAVVVTGNGKAFCAGGDIRSMAAGEGFYESKQDSFLTALDRKNSLWKKVQRIPLILEEIDKPVVAKINGAAYGAGLDMALMCDVRIASSEAPMCESYFKVGAVPGDGGAFFLPPLIGKDKALDMFWTCKVVSGEEALNMGLITYSIAPEELDEFTDQYMKRLVKLPQQALRFTKRTIQNQRGMSLRASLDMISSAMGIVTELKDYKHRTNKLVRKIQDK